MSQRWKFQLLPGIPNIIGNRFGKDPVMQWIESMVGDAIPFPLRFHKIQKLVITLGVQSPDNKPLYYESLGIAFRAYPAFDLEQYTRLKDVEKREILIKVVMEVLENVIAEHSDAQCFEIALKKLQWK